MHLPVATSTRAAVVLMWIAVWAAAPGAALAAGGVVLAREGQSAAAAGEGLSFATPFGLLEPRISSDGRTVVFPATLSPGFVASVWMARQDEGGEWSLAPIAVDGRVFENSDRLLGGSHSGVLDPETGRWVFAGELRSAANAGDAVGGLFIADGSGVRRIVADGESVPGGAAGETLSLPRPTSFANGPSLRASGGIVVFQASILGGEPRATGIFGWRDGRLELIARSGPSGTPPFVFNIETYPEVLVAASGAGALLSHAVTGQRFLFHVDAADNLFLIGTLGVPVPGVLQVPRFAGMTMSSTGALSYLSAASAAFGAAKTLYVFDNAPFPSGRLRRRAAPGDAAPGLEAGVTLADLGWPQMAGEWVAFQAKLSGGGREGVMAVYRARAADGESEAAEAVVAVGDALEVAGVGTTISRLYSFTPNRRGELLVDLGTASGQRLLAHAAKPRQLEVILGAGIPYSWSVPGEDEPLAGPGVLPQSPLEGDLLFDVPEDLLRNIEDGKGGPWFVEDRLALHVLDERVQPPTGMIVVVDLGRMVVNSTRDLADARPGDGRCDTGSDDPVAFDVEGDVVRECTLRAAIEEANATEARDEITVEIRDATGALVLFPEIRPESPLPAIEYPVTLDGSTQDDGEGPIAARVRKGPTPASRWELPRRNVPVLSGREAVGDAIPWSLTYRQGGELKGWSHVEFDADAVIVKGGSFRVFGTYFGFDPRTGNESRITGNAILLEDATDCQIGLPELPGVQEAQPNLITGFTGAGVKILRGASNRVQANTIVGIGSLISSAAVRIEDSSFNTIGGRDRGNLISGAGVGVEIVARAGRTQGNKVQGNWIGVDETGVRAASARNDDGVRIVRESKADGVLPIDTEIGGITSQDGNVISGNAGSGVHIEGLAWGTKVQGNRIGLAAGGIGILGNEGSGVLVVDSESITIGRENAVTPVDPENTGLPPGNLISGHLDPLSPSSVHGGIAILRSENVIVAGNLLGADGERGFSPNTVLELQNRVGVRVSDSRAVDITNNTISYSLDLGILVEGGSSDVWIQRNDVITTGTYVIHEEYLLFEAEGYGTGIRIVPESRRVEVSENFISQNLDLGIDLVGHDNEYGVTLNDDRDRDDERDGPNRLQNFPEISTPEVLGTNHLLIPFRLKSLPFSQYRIEFFGLDAPDDSDHGEGWEFLTRMDVTTPSSGESGRQLAEWHDPERKRPPYCVTATATFVPGGVEDVRGETSEFSLSVKIPWPDQDQDCAGDVVEGEAPSRQEGQRKAQGVPKGVGALPPGDGNGDGLPDAEQGRVGSFPTVDGGFFTVESPAGTRVSECLARDGGRRPAYLRLPHGMATFHVLRDAQAPEPLLAPGGAVAVKLFLPLGGSADTYCRFGPDLETGALSAFDFDGELGAEIAGDVITLHLRDGAPGDNDGEANGVIVHEGAPAIFTGACFASIACERDAAAEAITVSWALYPGAPDCDCESFEVRDQGDNVLTSAAPETTSVAIPCAELPEAVGVLRVACRKPGGTETSAACEYRCVPDVCPVSNLTCASDGERLTATWTVPSEPADCICGELEVIDVFSFTTLATLAPGATSFEIACDGLAETEGVLRVSCRGDEDLASSASCAYRCAALPEPRFVRGDPNGDGAADLADAVFLLDWLFLGEAAPGCLAAANVNGDGEEDISDVMALLLALFGGDVEIPPPYPDCGPATLAIDEALGCASPGCPP